MPNNQKRILLALLFVISCLLFGSGIVFTQQQLQKAKVEAMKQEKELAKQCEQCKKEVLRADENLKATQEQAAEKLTAAKQADPKNEERLKSLQDAQEKAMQESYKQSMVAIKNLDEAEHNRAMGPPAEADVDKWEKLSTTYGTFLVGVFLTSFIGLIYIAARRRYQNALSNPCMQPQPLRGAPSQIEARLQTLETLFASMEARLQSIEALLMDNDRRR